MRPGSSRAATPVSSFFLPERSPFTSRVRRQPAATAARRVLRSRQGSPPLFKLLYPFFSYLEFDPTDMLYVRIDRRARCREPCCCARSAPSLGSALSRRQESNRSRFDVRTCFFSLRPASFFLPTKIKDSNVERNVGRGIGPGQAGGCARRLDSSFPSRSSMHSFPSSPPNIGSYRRDKLIAERCSLQTRRYGCFSLRLTPFFFFPSPVFTLSATTSSKSAASS